MADESSPDERSLDVVLAASPEESLMQDVIQNFLILHNILKCTEDLETTRLVCSKWKRLATSILKKKNWAARKFIKFSTDEQNQKFLDTFVDFKENIMVVCWEMVPSHFFSDFDPKRYASYMNIFQTFPHSIKALKLDWWYQYVTPLFEPILRSQAESLVELIIRINWIPRDQDTASLLPKSFFPVEYYLPRLKYLKHRLRLPDSLNVFESVLSKIPIRNKSKSQFVIDIDGCEHTSEMIGLLKKYELVTSLRCLQMIEPAKENFGIMAYAGVELESLDICVFDRETKVEVDLLTQAIYQFLYHQKNSLKSLAWNGYAFKFPSCGMPSLTKLVLYRVRYTGEEVPEQNPIFYSQMFPTLQELELLASRGSLDSPSRVTNFLVSQLPCNTLQRLFFSFQEFNIQGITAISTIFPRIKFLKISTDSQCLEGAPPVDDQMNVYSALWNAEFKSTIEELIIEFYRFSWDQYEMHSIFTGATKEEIEQDFACAPGNSSIFNYTNLKRLTLWNSYYINIPPASLGEASALAIFGEIKNLEYLSVTKAICKFSPDAINDLKKSLPRLATFKNPDW